MSVAHAHSLDQATALAQLYLGTQPGSDHAHADQPRDEFARALFSAGLSARPIKPAKRFDDCDLPALCEVEGGWHLLVETSAGGLAIVLDGTGTRVPTRLTKKPKSAFAIGPLVKATGPLRIADNGLPKQDKRPPGLLRMLLPSRRVLGVAVLATFAINILALAMPIATMNIFDRVLTNNASETLMVLVIGVAVALGLDFALRGLRAAMLDRATAGNDITALTRVFARLVDAKPGATSVGNRTNALREYEGLREYFNASALASLGDLPFLVIFLGVLHWIAGSLVWIPIASGAALLCVIVCVQLRVRKLVEQQFAASATKNTVATELLAAIPTLQLAGAKRWARQKWERAAGDQLRQSIKLRFWTSFSTHLLVMFQGGTTIAILAVGAGAVMAENLSPGALFAANLLAARCLAPIAGIAGLGARFSQMRLSHNQIVDILQTPAETEDKANIVVPSPVRSLSMQTVSHRYSLEAPEALSRVDLTFNQGEWVAVIGAIGSGKSTLLDVLAARLQPTEGTAKADAFSLSEIDPGSWRAQVGFVPQNPAFFAGTLRENICLGRGFSDEAVVRAINLAGAGNWVDRSGKGLDMTIGERGHGLSGGQLQSLALARALVGDPDWLIMDEPTNNLDGQSESRVLNALSALKGKTALIAVTHRPALVESADRLVVMDEGKVKLDGPRADVLERLRQAVAEGTTELQPDAPTQAPAKTTIKVG